MSKPFDTDPTDSPRRQNASGDSRIRMAADRVLVKENLVHPRPTWREEVFTAADLQRKTFDPIKYAVAGIIPDGLSMLVGRPKIGKSWMALDYALAVASTDGTCLGGRAVEHGDVLYCACEDSQRRLQARITKLLGDEQDWPQRLHLTPVRSEWR